MKRNGYVQAFSKMLDRARNVRIGGTSISDKEIACGDTEIAQAISVSPQAPVGGKQALTVARKEVGAYFGSPMALIFVGTFLVATLFAFFWVETFFARNIADVRPLFRWMPVLMIFLVAALTMRQWSEEQRGGTLEILLTLPVRRSSLVLGKFMAVVSLGGVALVLTLFLPITVSLLGNLDWGPVVGGYVAALLMASAYAAIGLFVSSRTDNQIVALIITVLLCGVFYLVGSVGVTSFVGAAAAEILRAIGTGSRFESIERGVIDLRDLIYYLSLTVLFLVLNVISLDSKRWSVGPHTAVYRRNALLSAVLVGVNLVAANAWLFPVHGLRVDLTKEHEYSLSGATRDLINNLQEPLLIRGYFSEKTHPLLAPLVPSIRDTLREYEIAAKGKIEVEIVDPRDDEDLEAEANQIYGIRPTPLRISGRYEDTVINAYFDVLIRYGDQSVTLGFRDLIEVEQRRLKDRTSGSGPLEVRLRNLEYDLTRSIKKVVYGFQSLDAVFARMAEGPLTGKPLRLTAFVTAQTLPELLAEVPLLVQTVAQEIAQESGGKFVFEMVDLDDPNSPVTRGELFDTYGLRPFSVSLFSPDTYYLHLLLQIGDDVQILYPGGNVSEADLRTEIESALKRAVPGFLKTVGLWHPSEDPIPNPYTGSMERPLSSWQMVRTHLSADYTVKQVDLTSGRVPGDVDVLVVISPKGMTDRERFAIDQYLMRGGAVIVAAGNYILSPQQFGGGIMVEVVSDGLKEVLASYGIEVGDAMVMDPQNEPFPVQVQRQVGGMNVIETQQIDYPFFVDVRQDGMAPGDQRSHKGGDSPMVANLPAITLQWTSPIEIDEEENRDREVVVLFQSTEEAWLRQVAEVNPDLETYPELGFPIVGEQQVRTLAVSVRGSFDSYFQGRPTPFQGGERKSIGDSEIAQAISESPQAPYGGTIDVSPDSSRLVVIGSAEFLDDVVLRISQGLSQDRYLHNLQFLQNAVDWAVEDEDLLTIRSRGTYARLLKDMDKKQQSFWEGLNYAVALLGVIVIGVVWNVLRRSEEPMELVEEEAEVRRTLREDTRET